MRRPNPERMVVLWDQFVESYLATKTRPMVEAFLRGIAGPPLPQDKEQQ